MCLSSVVILSLGFDNWRLGAKISNNEPFLKQVGMHAYLEYMTERDTGTLLPSVCVL